ncbi:MAG: hypothetical protein NT040_19805 [Bacteroidetes bacterium]|nr:hypothetical protein [Bacteroidota bacterium]
MMLFLRHPAANSSCHFLKISQPPLSRAAGHRSTCKETGSCGLSQNADLVTPTLNLAGYVSVNLAFNHYFRYYTGSSGTVSYSINNGSTWTALATVAVTSTSNPSIFSQAVNAVAGQPQVKFKWNYSGTCGYYWGIDDLLITGTPCTPLPVSISIAASSNPFCANTGVLFTATTVNGGATPAFQWKVNGINAGTNSPTFSYNPVNNNVITCTLTSNANCTTGNPATSNQVIMSTFSLVPAITGAITGCIGNTAETYTTAPGMTGYSWNVSPGGQIILGAGTNTIAIVWNSPGNQTITVTYGNGAGCNSVECIYSGHT